MGTPPLANADSSDPINEPGHYDRDGEHGHTDPLHAALPADQQSPSTPVVEDEGSSGRNALALFVGILAVSVISGQVKWAFVIGAWLPGLLISSVVVIFSIRFVVRSDQSRRIKALFVAVLILAWVAGPVVFWIAH